MAVNFDTIIIGSGLLGLLTARELLREGQSVALFDRGEPGMESSWAGGGILSPLYPWRSPDELEGLIRWGQENYPALAEQLLAETGIDPEWCQSGLMILENHEAEKAIDWSRRTGLPCESVSTHRMKEIEPALKCEKRDEGLWLPEVAQVRNPHLIHALLRSLQEADATFKNPVTVHRLVVEQDSVQRIETTDGNFNAANFVISAGAWSNQLLAGLGHEIPVKPVRGQMLCLKAEDPVLQRILLQKGTYIIPRVDGHFLVGSTLEDVGFDKSTDDAARHSLLETAARIFPPIRSMTFVRHWSGLRPGTPDGIPYICACPGIANLYLNTGHFRTGITLAPGSARLLADILLCRETIVPVGPFSFTSRSVPA